MSSTMIWQLILVLVPILLPPLVGLVVYFTKAQIDKLPANARAAAKQAAATAVTATEQVANDTLNNAGKKQQALAFATADLKKMGLSVDEGQLANLIEEVVYTLKQSQNAAAVTTTSLPIGTTTDMPRG